MRTFHIVNMVLLGGVLISAAGCQAVNPDESQYPYQRQDAANRERQQENQTMLLHGETNPSMNSPYRLPGNTFYPLN